MILQFAYTTVVVIDIGDAADEDVQDVWVNEASAARQSFIRDIQPSSIIAVIIISIVSGYGRSRLCTRGSEYC